MNPRHERHRPARDEHRAQSREQAPEPAPDAPGAAEGPAATGPSSGAEPLADLRADLERERQRADDNWDKYLRAEADLDNFRKRSARLRDEALERQRRELLSRFLEVADNLERALAHGGADPEDLLAGVETTYRDLARIFAQEGVESMEALEEPFDPGMHEAVGVVPLPGEGPERVVVVERNGYTVNGELLRAARVIVGRPSGAVGDGKEPGSGRAKGGGQSGGQGSRDEPADESQGAR